MSAISKESKGVNRLPVRSHWRLAGLTWVLASILSGCGGSGETGAAPTTPVQTSPPTAWSLHSTTEAGLSAYFREALGPKSAGYVGSVWATDLPMATAATAFSTVGASVFSGTTVQEVGVDEADLVKSDGVAVFSLDAADGTSASRTVLRRQRLNANSADFQLTPVDSIKIPFSADMRGTGIYLDKDRQQVVAVAEGAAVWSVYDAWFAPQSWSQGVTEVALISTSNPSQLQQHRHLRMSAQLIGSRRVGVTLYLVMRNYPKVPGLEPTWPTSKASANQALINSLKSADLLPTISVDGAVAQPLVDAASCYVQEDNAVKSADIVTVVAIDLASSKYAARCFTGGSEAFYMSEQNLYLATTRTPYTYSGAFPAYAAQTSTDIHKFALNGLDINYRGSGNVVGHLGFDQNRKSFRMGEHLDTLRVITQTGTTWGGWITPLAATPAPVESPGHLSILQESAGNLILTGELPNTSRPQPLGKAGEQLYATRFIGTRGYLVTYRLTDPLYVLDLSNPADPKVAGELQVDGYSDYLFPLSDTLLLGVGKEAAVDGTMGDGRFAWYQGVKVSLIDVSDPSHPREAARSIIGRRGTDATVLHNHHGIALQTVGSTVRVSMPVSLHDTPWSSNTGAASDYFQFTRTELQKFDVDLASKSLSSRAALVSDQTGERDLGSDRALLWNDQVHYYQNGNWRSAGW